jgi:hypothetical protein
MLSWEGELLKESTQNQKGSEGSYHGKPQIGTEGYRKLCEAQRLLLNRQVWNVALLAIECTADAGHSPQWISCQGERVIRNNLYLNDPG